MKPLMKYHVTIQAQDGRRIKTWGVFPILNCKVLDGIYNPEGKELSILFDSVTEQYVPVEVRTPNGKTEIQQRKMDQYYKFRLPEEDIQFFIDNFVENDFAIEATVEELPKIIT
jgi:hypothetical protein